MFQNYKNPELLVNIWKDEPLIIIGGGTSILDFNISKITQEFKSIGVNNAAFDFNTDALWFSDDRWAYEWNAIELQKYNGIIAGCPHAPCSNLYWYKRNKPCGIEKRADSIAWNNNSGAGAINFAYHLGSRVIGLVGFDMKKGKKGEYNYHNSHKINSVKYNPFPLMIKSFEIIAEDAKKVELEIYNLNQDSDLQVFQKLEISEFINRFKKRI